ncbi:bifunctional hydroxymethylpyrimidine kinase/phosphomethylpyrimidine kinase [Roseospira marina]|uniref:hydroxymethylpyrimidine kinase n=1 Tax=Roseospira marina TaxID=140057 RepID=A0A5M6I778_9PROT|nr:bifunctional hydroxymethylpyrimidine kinase/phosphomethylpyrimidine kinase [Roseospira marina]KAA5604121.1 bifunctional hydroxymethylpyrimidine kinase/phosphomethylpyrimidine kinase [Roseospira marina]MBB4315775.1 hydroxymethylpyrimidine/phosphomethylpyrimidine kinase [Roseospira marina]MBB5088986.1 hydroxymethylpyrimidine/phosphomethylpyrimidine kinase [Roseospira marina]
MIPNILTIAGTDPSGGAGIQADIKAFSALGTYACSAITAVVAQNTQGVRSFVALEPSFVADQIDAVLDDVRIDAVKIGMIANAGIAEAVADRLRHHEVRTIVLDPVMVAKSGHALLDPDAVAAVRERLVPLATVITPNLPEAAVLLEREDDWSVETMQAALPALLSMGPEWVLLKGGHLTDSAESTDHLASADGVTVFPAPRIATKNDHGTGCTLSSAIAALLPQRTVPDAVAQAKAYLHGALAASDRLDVGGGHGPVHHFHALWANTADTRP